MLCIGDCFSFRAGTVTSGLLFIWLMLAASAALSSPSASSGKQQAVDVRYFTVPEDKVYGDRFEYIAALLELLLMKSGQAYNLQGVEVAKVPTSRNVKFLKQDIFNVIWIHTDATRERELRAIRYPVFRGLIGWRLFLISKANAPLFSGLDSIDELQHLKAGLGHDWPDVDILESAGFKVRTSYNWLGIYNLLANNRVDYFPRGINEIWSEIESIEKGNIARQFARFSKVEETIALKYPSAFYLFVTKENEHLATVLEQGFERALADGSFRALFMAHFGKYIRQSRLQERRIFSIDNNNLPAETPIQRSELWFSEKEPVPH